MGKTCLLQLNCLWIFRAFPPSQGAVGTRSQDGMWQKPEPAIFTCGAGSAHCRAHGMGSQLVGGNRVARCSATCSWADNGAPRSPESGARRGCSVARKFEEEVIKPLQKQTLETPPAQSGEEGARALQRL